MFEFYILNNRDVGARTITAFGKIWLVEDFIGQVLPDDVGKRVYHTHGILKVENAEQRDGRLAEYDQCEESDVPAYLHWNVRHDTVGMNIEVAFGGPYAHAWVRGAPYERIRNLVNNTAVYFRRVKP